jgi:hypothetical protein
MPGCRLPGPSSHKGTPGKAWPATSARCAPIALVARSDDVIPPWISIHMCLLGQKDYYLALTHKSISKSTAEFIFVPLQEGIVALSLCESQSQLMQN